VLSDGGPPHSGLNLEYWPAAGGLDFRSIGLLQAGLILGVINFRQQQAALILAVESSLTS
jgi:hypothetical protein